jgi:hypothetical protein
MMDKEQGELDSALDAALAKYAAVEPRAGLGDRVLANLRIEQARMPVRAWWRWSVAGALAAVVFVALALAWRPFKPSPASVENHSSELQMGGYPAIKPSVDGPNVARAAATSAKVRVVARRQHPSSMASNQPKLDQFPSPQPLSEQEKLLQNYVARYPEHAVLVARALTGALRPDQLKEVATFPSGDETADLKDQNTDTRER